jgi:hypothetical protein
MQMWGNAMSWSEIKALEAMMENTAWVWWFAADTMASSGGAATKGAWCR